MRDILQSRYLRRRVAHKQLARTSVLNDRCFRINKNLSVKPLSSTWIIAFFITICSLEIVQFVANLAMITALKCSGLSHAFRCVVEKTKMLFTSLGQSVLAKSVPSVLSTGLGRYPRPQAQFFPIRTSQLVNNLYRYSETDQLKKLFYALNDANLYFDGQSIN